MSLSKLFSAPIYLLASVVMYGLTSVDAALAQNAARPPRPIQDNSFLVEEAYNQEKGVVQHVAVYERTHAGESTLEFTQEWPLRGIRHQVSYTLPIELSPNSRLGAVMLNYRYQLRGDAESIVAVAPRFSVLLPHDGEQGVEASVPASIWIARQLVAHSNATVRMLFRFSGSEITPAPGGDGGSTSSTMVNSTTTVSLGQSLVWLAHPNVNLLFEALWEAEEGPYRGSGVRRATLSPGIRGAINFESGMQIVPGLAVPIGVGQSNGERALLVYLSVEHAF